MVKGASGGLADRLRPRLWLHIIPHEKRRPRRIVLQLEELETRALLAANAVAQPLVLVQPQTGPDGIAGYTPTQIQQAYGINTVLRAGTTGKGQTIAIVDASYDPTIAGDVAMFDKQFGLPAFNVSGGPNFSVVGIGSNGKPVSLYSLGLNSSWAMETALDVEWAHAIAPGANIVLVEVPVTMDAGSQLQDLLYGEQYAGRVSQVVSNSWGLPEFPGESYLDGYFTSPGNNVTFVAAAGDSGAYSGPIWPASSPYVLAVGGTSLFTKGRGTTTTYQSEWGWSNGGGGAAAGEGEPSFQANQPSIGAPDIYNPSTGITYFSRLSPDVAMVGDPATGAAVFDSFQQSGWLEVGGTSLGTPIWSAIVALADQQRAAAGKPPLDTYQVQTTLYNSLSSTRSYHAIFHDITAGSNGYSAGPGYDLVTGLGTPIVNKLVPVLASTTVSAVIPPYFVIGTGTGLYPYGSSSSSGTFSSSYYARIHDAPGSGLFLAVSRPSITLGSEQGSPGNRSGNAPPVTASTPDNSILPSLGAMTWQTPVALPGEPVSLTVPLNQPTAEDHISFGASGWSGSTVTQRGSQCDAADSLSTNPGRDLDAPLPRRAGELE